MFGWIKRRAKTVDRGELTACLRLLAERLAEHAAHLAYEGNGFTADGVRYAEGLIRKLIIEVEAGRTPRP